MIFLLANNRKIEHRNVPFQGTGRSAVHRL